jgi:diphosphomevalonate decarboxylase
MVTKLDVVQALLPKITVPQKSSGVAFAPSNIALCKYWGKRNVELNLPVTSSLSISLSNLGACTKVSLADAATDQIILNNEVVASNTVFYRRIVQFLHLIRPTKDTVFNVTTKTNIPVAAGLASSACGFAALVLALADLFEWPLALEQLSILARMGSGSACRSLWHGFVEWQVGSQANGLDSYAYPLEYHWPELRIGLLLVDKSQKPQTSSEAMQCTVETSPFYSLWPKTVSQALQETHAALASKDALMLSSTPAIIYSQAPTLDYMQRVWRARAEGLAVFFTQDAGPNLKLLYLVKDEAKIKELFAEVQCVAPFEAVPHTAECLYDL